MRAERAEEARVDACGILRVVAEPVCDQDDVGRRLLARVRDELLQVARGFRLSVIVEREREEIESSNAFHRVSLFQQVFAAAACDSGMIAR